MHAVAAEFPATPENSAAFFQRRVSNSLFDSFISKACP
jgi:hypothetical protein